jgi:hypothetical protein
VFSLKACRIHVVEKVNDLFLGLAETPFLSLILLKQHTNIDLQHPEHCLESFLNSKHCSVHKHDISNFIRSVTPTTTTPKQHRNTAQKDTDKVVRGTDSCAESSCALCRPVSTSSRQYEALVFVCNEKQSKSAICTLTRMYTNQPK